MESWMGNSLVRQMENGKTYDSSNKRRRFKSLTFLSISIERTTESHRVRSALENCGVYQFKPYEPPCVTNNYCRE